MPEVAGAPPAGAIAPGVAAVIPAFNEADRIAATVTAVRALPGVDLVVVVDDGSRDDTTAAAQAAGAEVVRHTVNRGKAAALMTGCDWIRRREAGSGGPARHLAFVDADLQETAANLAVLIEPVRAGAADLTIATLPPQAKAGGMGFVVRLARQGIERATGFTATQPLSGMRALTRVAYEAASPLARGWGVETAMTIDVLGAGLRVDEVHCQLAHRVSGTDLRGQLHRAGQYRDVWLALYGRRVAAVLLAASVALLVGFGWLGPNAASPDLGSRGWAPGRLPWTLPSWGVVALLATAYVAGTLGVWLGLTQRRAIQLAPKALLVLAVGAVLGSPFGSADHLNYAAYGQIWAHGGDPYVEPPVAWHGGVDPVTRMVEPPWTTTPSIYGPAATLLHGVVAWLGHDSMRQIVWLWQLVVIGAWLATRWMLRRLVADVGRVDLLWTLNPLVLGVGVLGAHVDVVATAFAVAALMCLRRSAIGVGMFAALAASTKVTYAVAGLAAAFAVGRARRDSGSRQVIAAGVAAAATVAVLHLVMGSHVYDQLLRARRSVSLGTPWRPVVDVLTGPISSASARNIVFAAAALVFGILAVALWRLTTGLASETVVAQAFRMTFVLAAAYVLAAPYSLPWYDQLVWATLPALAAGPLDGVLLGRGVVMALAYVPGRVLGMSARVERLTLGFRRYVAPYVGLLAWLLIGWRAGRRGFLRPSGSGPRESEPPSRS